MKLYNLKIFGLVIVIAIALLLPVGLSDYWQYVLTVAFFYVIMAVSWNLLGGTPVNSLWPTTHLV